MATYDELNDLAGQNVLVDRIAVAITIAADKVLNEANTTPNNAARLVWAKSAFNNPLAQAKAFQNAGLAANQGATVTQIINATDAAILANVESAINTFSGV